MQPGDTLLGIALEFETTVREIKSLNHLTSDMIVVGQQLHIASGLMQDGPEDVLVSDPAPDAEPDPAPVPRPVVVHDPSSPHCVNWRADLSALVGHLSKLPTIHEGGFTVVHGEAFKKAVADLDAAIPALEEHQIVVGMMRILAMLGDAHTGLNWFRWDAFQGRAFPIQLQWFSDGLFVTGAQPGYEELLKLEVVQIGGTPIARVLSMLAGIIPHEHQYGLRAASPNYMLRPVILHALGLTTDATRATFVFQTTDGQTVAESLHADSTASMQNRWVSALARQSAPLYLRRAEETFYWYTYLESSRALYVQYNVIGEDPEMPFYSFLEALSGAIAQHPVDRYIIDLRHNRGGSIGPPVMMLDHIKAHPQFSQRNKLFVLVGNQTFSSAVYFTSLLRQHANALIIGEPPAQGTNFYNSPLPAVLPHSGLNIYSSHSYLKFADVTEDTINPDVWVGVSSVDYFSASDPVLNRALTRP